MSLFEVEVKAKIKDPAAVSVLLLDKRAVFLRDELNEDIYFNHPSRDFAETDEAFRIRTIDSRSFLTYKGPKIGTAAKSRIERELGVDDFKAAMDIVTYLGFRESGRVRKHRRIYIYGDLTICLDSVDSLGEFIEIEMVGADRERLETEVLHFAEEIGISIFEKRSYLEMVLNSTGE